MAISKQRMLLHSLILQSQLCTLLKVLTHFVPMLRFEIKVKCVPLLKNNPTYGDFPSNSKEIQYCDNHKMSAGNNRKM